MPTCLFIVRILGGLVVDVVVVVVVVMNSMNSGPVFFVLDISLISTVVQYAREGQAMGTLIFLFI